MQAFREVTSTLPVGWSTVDIAGHAGELFLPQRRHAFGFVAIYLHGVHLQRLADHPPFVEELERHGVTVIAPRSARSWWTDRICPEFDDQRTAERYVVRDVLAWAEQNLGVVPPQIALLGTSMGGQGALRISYKYPQLFPVVAAISPAIDFQIGFYDDDSTVPTMYSDPEAARQDTATLHIHPLNYPRHQFFCCDPTDLRWWESSDRLRMKLYSLGVPHECDLETSHGGHSFTYYNHQAGRAVQFLVDRLEQERRRVPATES